jgi:hypothetical protein
MSATGAYPTPPGSGNVYAREFLSKLFPLGNSSGEATDSYTLAAAPYLGDVVAIVKPLVRYRIHDKNLSALTGDPTRFTQQIERALQRHRFALRLIGADAGVEDAVRVLRRGRHLLQMRVSEHRLCEGPAPLPGDDGLRLLVDILASPRAPGPESVVERIAISLWCLATLSAPLPIARLLILARFR